MMEKRHSGKRRASGRGRSAAGMRGAPAIVEALKLADAYLHGYGIESSRLNAELLLSSVLGCTRLDLYLRFDERLGDEARERYREGLRLRARHYPLQYIIGEVVFHSLPFVVCEGVFVPRPETELLVDRIEELLPGARPVFFMEMGVGTGVIAATLAVRHPSWRGVAFDVCPEAARLARENASRLGVSDRLAVCAADGFAAFESRPVFDLLVANPPYIPAGAIDGLQEEVSRYENRTALDGGADGMRYYPLLAEAGASILRSGGLIAMEIGDGQGGRVEELLCLSAYERIETGRDYNGKERVVTAFRPHAVEEKGDG